MISKELHFADGGIAVVEVSNHADGAYLMIQRRSDLGGDWASLHLTRAETLDLVHRLLMALTPTQE